MFANASRSRSRPGLPSHHALRSGGRKSSKRLSAVIKLLLFCVFSAIFLWGFKKVILAAFRPPEGSYRAMLEQDEDAPAKCTGPNCNEPYPTADTAAKAHTSSEAHTKLVNPASGLYTMSVEDTDGRSYRLDHFSGQVSLVVNVASQCGYTESNYVGLQKLYDKYHPRGFEVLAFPCNAFGQQEPGSLAEIQAFAKEKYHATFPIFPKVEVNGPSEHAIFNFLKSSLASRQAGSGDISWNFNKFLVNRHGHPVKHYASTFDEQELERDIEAELAGNSAAHAAS